VALVYKCHLMTAASALLRCYWFCNWKGIWWSDL